MINKPVIGSDEDYVYWMLNDWDGEFYTVGDFKKFLSDNNISDDTPLEVSHDRCYTDRPNLFLYDKKANKVHVKTP